LARPRTSYHIHFTKRGDVRMGMAVIDAMMANFDRLDLTTHAHAGAPVFFPHHNS
jgi:hypothetical protein